MDSDAHDLDGILAMEVRLHASSTADTSPRPLFLGGVEPGGIDVWGEVRGGGSNNLRQPGMTHVATQTTNLHAPSAAMYDVCNHDVYSMCAGRCTYGTANTNLHSAHSLRPDTD